MLSTHAECLWKTGIRYLTLFRVIVFPYGQHRAKLQHRLAARLRRPHARLKNFAKGRRDDQRLREEMEEHLGIEGAAQLRVHTMMKPPDSPSKWSSAMGCGSGRLVGRQTEENLRAGTRKLLRNLMTNPPPSPRRTVR
jgi:hypothetical protein